LEPPNEDWLAVEVVVHIRFRADIGVKFGKDSICLARHRREEAELEGLAPHRSADPFRYRFQKNSLQEALAQSRPIRWTAN
jgi:hypothetical protein